MWWGQPDWGGRAGAGRQRDSTWTAGLSSALGWSRHEVSWMGTAKELAFCSVCLVGLLLGEGLRSTVSMPRLNVSVSAVFSWPGFLLTPHALPKHFY